MGSNKTEGSAEYLILVYHGRRFVVGRPDTFNDLIRLIKDDLNAPSDCFRELRIEYPGGGGPLVELHRSAYGLLRNGMEVYVADAWAVAQRQDVLHKEEDDEAYEDTLDDDGSEDATDSDVSLASGDLNLREDDKPILQGLITKESGYPEK
ncbi:hypothetical protein VTK73DRAFT_319 [Phialemonium thermophilum]|uniref:Uncharacterized protein n=1 Tax=Phialemonium thermophilum TaxID=223376 RepID=A0ABR3VVS4_9PEZI